MKPTPIFIALLVSTSLLSGCASWGLPIGMPLRNKTRFESEWCQYKKLKGFKALAVAGNLHGRYVSGWTSDCCEQQKATVDAVNHCEQRRRDRQIADACRVYAIGDEIVQGGKRGNTEDGCD